MSVPESIVERQMLVDQYALWVSYRRETKKKPLQPQTSLLHANKVAKCIDTDGLSAAQVERLFENAMEREWEGWYFESEVIKLKAEGMPVKNKKTPPRDLGSIGIPAGALGFEGGVL